MSIKFDFPQKIISQTEIEVECSNGHTQKTKVEVEVDLKRNSSIIKSKKIKCKKCRGEIIIKDNKKRN